jgi:hypothetical protein
MTPLDPKLGTQEPGICPGSFREPAQNERALSRRGKDQPGYVRRKQRLIQSVI